MEQRLVSLHVHACSVLLLLLRPAPACALGHVALPSRAFHSTTLPVVW
jgi:hypothetical protein